MIDKILQAIGLVTICYGVWRLVMLALDDYAKRQQIRDVMEGHAVPPWEPTTVRVIQIPYDQDQDIA